MKALFEAIANHGIKAIRIIIREGIDLNVMLPYGTTPRIMAARKGYTAMENSNTAFTEAALHGDKTTMIILLQYEANPHHIRQQCITRSTFTDIQNLDYTRSYPSAVDLAIMVGNIDAVTILLNRGVKHNLTSCLHTALFAKRQMLVQFFIDRGATPPTTLQGKLSLLRCMSLFTPAIKPTDPDQHKYLKKITNLCYDTHSESRTSL